MIWLPIIWKITTKIAQTGTKEIKKCPQYIFIIYVKIKISRN
jgi:hypothetical protein